ncbi:hypothetical protein GCM10027521_43570 [Amycolatopsis cihanbeyliensis]
MHTRHAAAARPAREARRLIRARAHKRPLRLRLMAAADAALYVAMFAGLVTGAAQAGLEQSGRFLPLIRPEIVPLVRWVAVIAIVLLLITMVKLLLTFGPVLVRSPVQAWLLTSPIDRRSLLLRVYLLLLCMGTAGGVAIGVVAVIAAQLPAAGSVPWLMCTGFAGTAAVSITVLVQQRPKAIRRTQLLLSGALIGCAGAVVLVLLLAPGTRPSASVPLGADATWWALASTLTICVVTVWVAGRALGRLTRAALASGRDIAEATAVATTFLEPTILWSLLLLRRMRGIGRVRSATLSGRRVTALIRADIARLRRNRAAVALWLCLLPVPYLATAVLPAMLVPAVHLVAAFLVTTRLANGLRVVFGSAALRRAIGGRDRVLLLAHLVVPAAGTLLWGLATSPAIPSMRILATAISIVGAVLVTYRIATRPPIEYVSPMLDMGFGGVPIGLIIQLSRGPALLILLCWAQMSLG